MSSSERAADLELLEIRAEAFEAPHDHAAVEDDPDVPSEASLVYLVDHEVQVASDADMQRSDAPLPAWMGDANPGNWHPIEWAELLEGRLGPWAMASEGERVVSICHTPVPMTVRAAEVGVWTDPEFRGQGHAAAVTAQWAAILRPSGRYLFYSTGADNLSSQRVAGRLEARLLGRTWQLGRAEAAPAGQVHPLCSLRRSGSNSPEDFESPL